MLSRRLPAEHTPNAWAAALEVRRREGARLLDLTEANPTRTGLAPDPATLALLATPAAARYEPDPRGWAPARAAVAAYYAERGARIDPAHVVLTSGTSEGYAHLFRLLANPGESVLVPSPSYPLFEPLAALESVRLVAYRLAYDGAWHLDRAGFESALRDAGDTARAVIVVEPNHPTGTCLSDAERDFVEEHCARRGLAIVSDEVFGDYAWSAPGARAAPRPLPAFAGRAAVPTYALSGLSKVCGLPQLKLSWIAVWGPTAAREQSLGGLEWIADLFLSVSTPVQLALPRLLETRHRFQALVRERLALNLERLESLTHERPEVSRLTAAGGWVAILRLPARASDQEWSLRLLERDVVAHPGHFYDLAGGSHLVVSLIVEPRVFAQGIARLAACLA
jgi:alanine-synthesizing transaminase